jgi:hypothetical protein
VLVLAASSLLPSVPRPLKISRKPGFHPVHEMLERSDVQVRKLTLAILLHARDE